jgi:beta-lactamase class A
MMTRNGAAAAAIAALLAGCFGSPRPDHPPDPERDRQRDLLARDLETRLRAIPGSTSLYFKDIDTDETITFTPDRVVHAAGVIQLYILIETFQRGYEGTLDLDAPADLVDTFPAAPGGPSFAPGDAPALRDRTGPQASARRLCEEMVGATGNAAADNLVLRLGGPAAVTLRARALGASHTGMPRYLTDEPPHPGGPSHTTSANDVGETLEKLARGLAVNPETSRDMIQTLVRARGGFIPRLLPPADCEVAHMPGAARGVRHDAGVVTCANGTYVLAVMLQDLADDAAGETAGAQISRRVFDYIQSRPR